MLSIRFLDLNVVDCSRVEDHSVVGQLDKGISPHGQYGGLHI